MHNSSEAKTAFLKSSGNYTYFTVGDKEIRFRTSSKLNRYTEVRKWDAGYLVVMADYQTLGITEEYIDMVSILNELYFDAHAFLAPIKEVRIKYE
ncbi:MAG: hypothetical protein IJS09_09885 [Treponema sp.]|nr:hypothetical protein [Treponema sp.]